MLRDEFGFSPQRATTAVRAGRNLQLNPASDPVGAIAGFSISRSRLLEMKRLLPGTAGERGGSRATLSSVRSHIQKGTVRELAAAAVRSKDQPTVLVTAALIAALGGAGLQDFVTALQSGLVGTGDLEGRHPNSAGVANRMIGAAYGLSATSRAGLDLGSDRWSGQATNWRFRAAPWVLPLVEPRSPEAVVELLTGLADRQLSFVLPGENPFPCPGSPESVALARDTATSAATDISRWYDRPMWFDGGPAGPQILLVEDDSYAYAWVGRAGRGMLVAFGTEGFDIWRLREPGTDYALTAAIGWYIDVSVSLRREAKGSAAIRRSSEGTKRRGATYRPTPVYEKQRRDVEAGERTPPRPHLVARHVRDLGPERWPNLDHIADAPPRVQRMLGPHDTWVRAHQRGKGTPSEWVTRLTKWSALADLLGMMERPVR
jgi:hypothetical protein